MTQIVTPRAKAHLKDDLFAKPPPVQSGKHLKRKVVVQHRSDLLLEEQMMNVKNVQEALKKALHELQHAREEEEFVFYRARVDELQQKSDQMVILLQLVYKINIELAYARAMLQKALKAGTDISAARKRVGWLEDRMEKLLGRRRQRGTSRHGDDRDQDREDPRHLLNSFHQMIADERGTQSSGEVIDTKELLRFLESDDYNTTLSEIDHAEYPHDGQHLPHIPRDGASRARALMYGDRSPSQDTVSSSRTDKRGIKANAGQGELGLSYPEDTDLTHYPKSTRSADRHGKQPPSTVSTSRGSHRRKLSQEWAESPDEAELSNLQEREDEESLSVLVTQPTPHQQERGNLSPLLSERSPSSTGTTDPQAPGVFLTEGSTVSTGTKRSKGSRVTVKTPTELDDYLGDQYISEVDGEEDEPQAYWSSEHHRFEYSSLNPIVEELDVTSYHQMGLAVPGTFVKSKERTSTDLPWRPKDSAADITDIHQQALDKLSVKVHKMYDKVSDAAMLSVDPHHLDKEEGGPSFLSNFETLETPVKSNGEDTSGKSPTKQSSTGINKEETSVSLPSLKKERLGSSTSGRLIYYPNPLPYPNKLPITRTARDKVFPRKSESFEKSGVTPREPATRVADQRNLQEETKFTSSLFRTKKKVQTPVTNENHLRNLLAMDSPNPEPKQNVRAAFKVAKTMASLADSRERKGIWKDSKPKPGLAQTGLRWERIKGIVHKQLLSTRVEDRITAARQLRALKSEDPLVINALKERVLEDEEERVRYEACKALVTLGCWEEEILEVAVSYLENGNQEVCADLIKCMANGKNVQFVNKRTSVFPRLVKVLGELSGSTEVKDTVAFEAAVCLGKLCVPDDNAKEKLKQMMNESQDTHIKAQALDILVRQMNVRDIDVFYAILDQVKSSPVWKYRKEATRLLILLGPDNPSIKKNQDKIFDALELKLWDEPNKAVRQGAAKALASLNMFPKACEHVEKNLEDTQEMKRVQAVVSAGTLSMNSERVIRQLLEMLELDSSEYVRLMIIRTLGVLNVQSNRVIRALNDKEKIGGPLAREAGRALDVMKIPRSNGLFKVMSWLGK